VTYYRPAPEADRRLFEMVKKHYDKIYFWPQQDLDVPYVRQLGLDGMIPIEPNTAAYNRVLDEEDVDFVGSRLHGGIRALQRGRRAMIVPVDNRAIEISKSSGLPVVSRDEPDEIARWITQPAPTKVVLPTEAIETWKNQFAAGVRQNARASR
jgi:hypothetical protein